MTHAGQEAGGGPCLFRGLCRGRKFDQEWRGRPYGAAGRPATVASRTRKNQNSSPSGVPILEEEGEEGKGEETEKRGSLILFRL